MLWPFQCILKPLLRECNVFICRNWEFLLSPTIEDSFSILTSFCWFTHNGLVSTFQSPSGQIAGLISMDNLRRPIYCFPPSTLFFFTFATSYCLSFCANLHFPPPFTDDIFQVWNKPGLSLSLCLSAFSTRDMSPAGQRKRAGNGIMILGLIQWSAY